MYFINNVKVGKTRILEVTGCQTNFGHENTIPKAGVSVFKCSWTGVFFVLFCFFSPNCMIMEYFSEQDAGIGWLVNLLGNCFCESMCRTYWIHGSVGPLPFLLYEVYILLAQKPTI